LSEASAASSRLPRPFDTASTTTSESVLFSARATSARLAASFGGHITVSTFFFSAPFFLPDLPAVAVAAVAAAVAEASGREG
jgi:hypothetical protein